MGPHWRAHSHRGEGITPAPCLTPAAPWTSFSLNGAPTDTGGWGGPRRWGSEQGLDERWGGGCGEATERIAPPPHQLGPRLHTLT